jgi:4'-phosphopantetheinyl transferase EntD
MDVSTLAPPGAVLISLVDEGQAVALHPQETPLVARAGEKRRRDFALGRACARAALAVLDFPAGPVGRTDSGAPLWPDGAVGSISHTRGFAAALVGPAAQFRGLGIDAERGDAMDDALAPRLFVASERVLLSRLDAARRRDLATMLFSAKEACYKLLHPLTGQRLDFHQLEIVPGAGQFTARWLGATGDWARPLMGRFVLSDGLVVTAVGLAVSQADI